MLPTLAKEKILLTGPTSQVAFPIARALAERNEVHGLARFRRREDRERLEALGITCHAVDLGRDSLASVPRDFTYVLNFAVARSTKPEFDRDLAANAEGAGRLMAHCRATRAFLHCSSGAVYRYAGHHALMETDPLGDSHWALFPTYSISKIAAEAVVRFAAREWGIPTTIARLGVPYGDNGGWPWIHLTMMKAGRPIPVHPEKPNLYNPIHEDDYVAHVPGLLAIARVPARIINWGGSEPVSIEAWCEYLGELTGLEPRLDYTLPSLGSVVLDVREMERHLGKTTVPWRDGLRRLVAARSPELLRT